ncbi:hypothetical protein SAMN05421858_1280 [Haladaptatus litoreus]|uniref:Uncharacterized protein n=1 Tax=Haladaptatus litoreus TaxID=553468 RepID=A0A1N6XUX9_9EURY|nr:hypothetical protein [Haladaptatus litoreus]SIR05981.1 hypothetical protein SAMN05421858_1280 [Haladaptatus litoreus]
MLVSDFRQRAFLTATTTAPIVGSGCLGILDSPEARFGRLDFINADDKPHEFHIVFERDGARIHELSRRVASDDIEGFRVNHEEWASKPARYTLSIAVADDRNDVTYTEDGCHDLILNYRPGRIGIYSHNHGEKCEK